MSIIPVILSGGSGTRLWPVSRKSSLKPEATTFEDVLYREVLKSGFIRPEIVELWLCSLLCCYFS